MSLTRASASVIKTEEIVGTRNRIINGDMRIYQRNTGTVNSNSSVNPYTLDRWRSVSVLDSNTFSVMQSTDAPQEGQFVNSLLVTSLAATTLNEASPVYHAIRHPIEANNFYDMMWGTPSASPVTLSFWVKSSLTGTFGGAIANNTTPSRSFPFSYIISSANTWEYKTVTIPGDTTGTYLTGTNSAVNLWFALNSVASRRGTPGVWNSNEEFSVAPTGATNITATNGATFYLTGVQLEKGSTATPFERRPFGTELALCQRYYYRLKQTSGSNCGVAAGVAYTTTLVYGQVNFPVEMRVAPTALEQNGTAADYDTLTNGNLNVCTSVPTFENATVTTSLLTWRYSSSTVTVGSGAICRMRNSTSYLAWSAEL
jgi:hypothetical protein